jgi:hypothetical protein
MGKGKEKRRRPEERRHQGDGVREEMTPVELTWILLNQKMKKIIRLLQMDGEDLK